jgi:integrase
MVDRIGLRSSAVFDTKAEAVNWATKQEAALLATKRGLWPRKSLAEAMHRYAREVSPRKRRGRAEGLRLAAFCRDFPAIAAKRLPEVSTTDMATWRDARLQKVTPASVERDLRLISNVFTVARDEWKWCGESPLKGLWRPGENPARTRRVLPSEVRRLCRWLGYRTGDVQTKQQQVALAILIALRTAMRAGEILQLGKETLDLDHRVARVSHKTQAATGAPRSVPLSRAAIRVIRPIAASGFTITGASLDALFRKARNALMIEDLHFHDCRGEALTRMARKVDVMTLARISGHKDLRVLLDHYYRESASDIAARLD